MKRTVVAIACATLAGAAGAVGQNISVTDVQNVSVLDAETQVDVASGGTAEFAVVPYDVTVRAQAGGKVRLGIHTDDTVTNAPWAPKVGLWLDGSLKSSFDYVNTTLYKPSGVEGTSVGTNARIIYRWYDRRDTDHTMEWRGYNNRATKVETTGKQTDTTQPYVIDSGDYLPNGKAYVSLGTCAAWGRRLPFIQVVNGVEQAGSAGSEPKNAIPATYVMMVIDTQNGGGQAVLSSLPRASTNLKVAASVGIFASNRETRLDGADVADPTTTGFNGGWQTLAFSASGASVTGLGYAKWETYTYGGQNYAEVLVFTNAPTAAEIRSAEAYLAEKWGIETYVEGKSDGSVRLYGAGAAEVIAGEAKLGGSFQGTMTVAADATLKLTDTSSVPTNAAALTAGAQTALQFDTDREDLTTSNDGQYKCTNYDSLNRLSNIIYPDYMPLRGETDRLRAKYGYTAYDGEPLEFHASGMVTFGLLGTSPAAEQKVRFDPDRKKRRAMYAEVSKIFKDYSVYIGGSTSFDFAGPKYNKYDATLDWAKAHGYAPGDIVFIGDDFADGGGDSHVRIGDMDHIVIKDYKNFAEAVQVLLKEAGRDKLIARSEILRATKGE